MTVKVFCETCHAVFDEESQRSTCPHGKIGDLVLAVRADGQSAAVPSSDVQKYIGAKAPGGTPVELKLVVQRKDGVIPDRIEIQNGTVLTTSEGQSFKVQVPWTARFRAWLRRVFRRAR